MNFGYIQSLVARPDLPLWMEFSQGISTPQNWKEHKRCIFIQTPFPIEHSKQAVWGYDQNASNRGKRQKWGSVKNQFRFRKNRSTYNTCDWIVDVPNAFNAAKWNLIIEKLEWKGVARYLANIIRSYFKDRQLQAAKGHLIQLQAGVPQGSLLSLLLWNLLFDNIFHIDLLTVANIIGYVDDFAWQK